MTALFLTKDLFFSSKVTGAAAACQLEMTVVPDESQLLERIEQGGAHLVLFDFSTPGLNLQELVPRLREQSKSHVTVLAFGPHVDAAGMTAAKQAGCDHVYTRGQFHKQMAAILREHGCTV